MPFAGLGRIFIFEIIGLKSNPLSAISPIKAAITAKCAGTSPFLERLEIETRFMPINSAKALMVSPALPMWRKNSS